MATLLLRGRSGPDITYTLYSDVLITDQGLVADMTSSYRTTLIATWALTPIVASPTTSPQGILHLVSAHFMREAKSSLPQMLKYYTRQQLKLTKQVTAVLLS